MRGSSGGGGGAGGGSSSKASSNAIGASGTADGVLSVTPDSPADSEWRSRRGPLDASEGGGGPWGEEDAPGGCQCPRAPVGAAAGTTSHQGSHVGFHEAQIILGQRFCWAVRLINRPCFGDDVFRRRESIPYLFLTPLFRRRLPRALDRPSADGPVRQVHLEDRKLLGNLQARVEE